jgi:hypothetical protein
LDGLKWVFSGIKDVFNDLLTILHDFYTSIMKPEKMMPTLSLATGRAKN